MTLQEFGTYLTERRESRSLSIHDIANSLKLSSRVVQAMEDVTLEDLPHAAYVRAFYFSYAATLGIDDELVHTALEELVLESSEESSIVRMPVKASGRRLGTLLLLFLFVVALFAVVYAIMSSSMFSDLSSMTSKPKTQQSAQVFSSGSALAEKPVVAPSMPSATPSTMPSTMTVAEASPQTILPAVPAVTKTTNVLATTKQVDGVLADNTQALIVATDGQKTVQPTINATASLITPTAQEVNPAPKTPVVAATKPVGTNYLQMDNGTRHTLILTGGSGSWLRVTVGETVRQFTIMKGQVLTVRFDNTAILRLGNAGGVTATFDGRALPPFGVSGEVRTVTFPNL